MFFTYILHSEKSKRYYCGQTGNLTQRIRQHNDPTYKGSLTTKRFQGPWQLIWSQESATRSEAMLKEKQIKKRGIKRFLETQLAESRQWRD